jgi:hypothetical protein
MVGGLVEECGCDGFVVLFFVVRVVFVGVLVGICVIAFACWKYGGCVFCVFVCGRVGL